MKQRIIDKLKQLEHDQQIRILLAVETGSRAWGFPSPDSDFDIRLIYVKEADWYIRLTEGKDNISYMSEDGELDLTGWELRKALRLMAKSNTALLERVQSPIVYLEDGDFAQEMRSLASDFYSPVAVMHHYYSMALKSFDDIKYKETYRLKSLFYALRATCACLWILEQDRNPPIVYSELLAGLKLAPNLSEKIASLTMLKATKSESYMHPKDEDLVTFITETLIIIKQAKNDLQPSKGNTESLNVFLRSKIVFKK
ncbi:MAG: nucleotidyltransferase [Bacteroidetes bacterium]|nr:MAG: nucleotidyltransferase [Bacteroidota bacterium]